MAALARLGGALRRRAPYGAGRLRRRPRFARRGLSSLGLGLATLGLAKLRKSLFASCLIGWACSIALAAAKPWYLCRGLSKSATFFCCFAIQQASAGGMGGWHAVPKRSGGSPVDALVHLGALGLRFPMFRRATFWEYVFLIFGAYDALARRLCSESLPRQVADALGLRFPTLWRLCRSRATPVQRIASKICSVHWNQKSRQSRTQWFYSMFI